MKNFKKFTAIALLCTMLVPIAACDNSSNDPINGTGEATANTVSASLLDGKVANLMSAEGIGIQDKNAEALQSSTAQASLRTIMASADGETTMSQAKNELVKQTDAGVEDVRFHDGSKGGYRDWNKRFSEHHHGGNKCPKDDCDERSDEIVQEEQTQNIPTIVSLDARVNKLYNAGDFTFVCVSAAVQGEAKVLTRIQKLHENPLWAYAQWGVWMNTEEHYRDKEDKGSISISYMTVKSGDKKGTILVKRSEAETGYHTANYWNDDFNQSYLIDNATGKTYSLSQFPQIYSVKHGVLQVANVQETGGTVACTWDFYKPSVDENGELALTKLEIPQEAKENYELGRPLIDKHGNIVFLSHRSYADADEYGEKKIDGYNYIFSGYSQEVYDRLSNDRSSLWSQRKPSSYLTANRYQLGSDGQIYRFDYRGDMNNIPVQVLGENATWQAVPADTDVDFTSINGWVADITVNASRMQWLIVTRIANGTSFFANAALGSDLPFTMNTDVQSYGEQENTEFGWSGFIGVAALPTAGGLDAEMKEFMDKVHNSQIIKSGDIVYRVGSTAFAYMDRSENQLVIWDRLSGTKQSIAVGGTPFLQGRYLLFTEEKGYRETCFQANTANGTYYIGYTEEDPTKEWSEYSTAPIEKTLVLDAYYELLREKTA
ncbi:MAG: hypothetical protein IJX98_01905 [Clostridia bacterium]|nr:hypothetical protein [Clostridia bacterium]